MKLTADSAIQSCPLFANLTPFYKPRAHRNLLSELSDLCGRTGEIFLPPSLLANFTNDRLLPGIGFGQKLA